MVRNCLQSQRLILFLSPEKSHEFVNYKYTCQLHKLSAWERFRVIKSSIICTEQHVA